MILLTGTRFRFMCASRCAHSRASETRTLRKELVTALVSVSAIPTTHATSEVMPPSAELAALLPPGWSLDFPLARVRTCGALVVEVVQELHPGPGGRLQAIYGPPAADLFHIKGMTTALLLLALLASQPGGFASKDFLTQTLPHLRRVNVLNEEDDLEEDGSLARLDNQAAQAPGGAGARHPGQWAGVSAGSVSAAVAGCRSDGALYRPRPPIG